MDASRQLPTPPKRLSGLKRRASLIGLITVSAACVLLVLGVQSVQRIEAVEGHWVDYSRDAAEAERLLHNISQHMGYGGFIHNFKNYVLRQNRDYLDKLNNDRKSINADLDRLMLLAISDEEKRALSVVRGVLDQYAGAVELAGLGFMRGLSSRDTDAMVKIEDGLALVAIAELNLSFMNRARLAEEEIDKGIRAANSMIWILLAVVPVILILGLSLVLFLRRMMEAHANLAEVRDELEVLLQQAPDAILHVDKDGAIVRANDRALTLFEYDLDELLSKSVEEIIPGSYSKSNTSLLTNAFDALLPKPLGNNEDFYAVTKDGQEVPIEVRLNFSYSGGERIATAIIRDVTERKRVEQVLQQVHYELEQRVHERTAELEQRTIELEGEMIERRRAESQLVQSSKMATIGEMASGITHELNQPMNIMRMGVEAAQIRIQRGQADIASLSETLERVEGQILRMSDIINHMRVYSRQDTESQTPFDPIEAVREGCNLFAGQLAGLNVELVTDIVQPESTRETVRGHAIRMEQVILNLLSNARDAVLDRQAREGDGFTGCIRVRVHDDDKSNTVHIDVDDNGGGIPDDILPHIFAPFVTSKESGRGTGLGLSVSYGIVEGMGGMISASNINDGARFEISLPRTDEAFSTHVSEFGDADAGLHSVAAPTPQRVQADASLPMYAARTRRGAVKVLIVDDEKGAAHSLSSFLQDLGYLVYAVYNGVEAMHIFASDPVDVVITDLRMPEMGGEELIRRLRVLTPSLPIFAMTGQGDFGDHEISKDLGATEVWRKPVSLGEVAKRLEQVCGSPGS